MGKKKTSAVGRAPRKASGRSAAPVPSPKKAQGTPPPPSRELAVSAAFVLRAKRKGIVPGVYVESPLGTPYIVPPVSKWRMDTITNDGSVVNGGPHTAGVAFIYDVESGWAKVLTPPTAQHAIGIGAKPKAVRRTEAKRSGAKPGPKASPKPHSDSPNPELP